MSLSYPRSAAERTRWITERRGSRNTLSVDRPYAFFNERERRADGSIEEVSTVFLTNRECPWKCAMCDLWRNTTDQTVSAEQVMTQLEFALAQLPAAPALKIYNSGSFFDPAAIPPRALSKIADLCRGFRHLIVECHPRLIGSRVLDFAASLSCTFEVALGLETAHTLALEALNKRITVEDYRKAAALLKGSGIELRTFLLVHPPFVPAAERAAALRSSVEMAIESGSGVVSLIPLRAGNGAVDDLIQTGQASLPALRELEDAQEMGIQLAGTRCFADTWDLEIFSHCSGCLSSRSVRIQRMNVSQKVEPRVVCSECGHD